MDGATADGNGMLESVRLILSLWDGGLTGGLAHTIWTEDMTEGDYPLSFGVRYPLSWGGDEEERRECVFCCCRIGWRECREISVLALFC